jgi:hypothetical protein
MNKPRNTERNRAIVDMFKSGHKAREIAAKFGMGINAVYQVRYWENQNGANVPSSYLYGDENITVWYKAIEEHNEQIYSAADEAYDDDEPYGPVQHCKCGLRMPCNDCLDLANYTRPVASRGWENFAVMPVGHSTSALLPGKTKSMAAIEHD